MVANQTIRGKTGTGTGVDLCGAIQIMSPRPHGESQDAQYGISEGVRIQISYFSYGSGKIGSRSVSGFCGPSEER
jgi:hypothetical protein